MTQELRENFTLKFDGVALTSHEMPVSILAESLVALQNIAQRANKVVNGKDAEMTMKVRGGFTAGSFEIQLILDWACQNTSLVVAGVSGVVGSIVGAVQLYRWAKGKDVAALSSAGDNITVQDSNGETAVFNNCTVSIYQSKSLKNEFSRLTGPLDMGGVESISIIKNGISEEVIPKAERELFKTETGIVISDQTGAIQLEVVMPSLNGSPKGWRFYEGEGGVEFTATIEDENFLEDVRQGRHSFKSGTCLLVELRTSQKKLQRTITERTVIEVLQLIPPE